MKKKIIGNPEEKNRYLIDLINKIKFNDLFLDRQYDFRDIVLKNIIKTDDILDVGKSMREKYEKIQSKSIETLDVNDFGDYPDIIFDLCDENNNEELFEKYDKIICLAVLEHVYNPFLAVNNLFRMLKKGGIIYGFVPFLYHYHGPETLKFQDYFRFSKDALAYLFKDFSEIELFPVRGKISAPLHIIFTTKWKRFIERLGIHLFLDKISGKKKNRVQCSGYYFILKK